MSFFLKKRFLLLIPIILFILIAALLLKNYSTNIKYYILTNEMLPKVSVFLIKKHYDTIENINFTKINKKYLNEKKIIILDFLRKEKEKMKLSYLNNKVIQNLNISTGITIHDRIFFNFSYENNLLFENTKNQKLISNYIKDLNNRFKLLLETQLEELEYYNRIYVYNNRVHINPYVYKEELEFVVSYESSIISNKYLLYFVSFIYLILILVFFSLLKENLYKLKINPNGQL